MVIAADYPLLNIFWTMILFFAWVVWIWMVIVIFADVFTRRDISGWGKAAWSVLIIALPFIGVLCYLIADGSGMAERKAQQSEAARADYDDHIRSVASTGGASTGGAATEIAQAKQLLDSGAISEVEFTSLKAKALA